MTPPAWWPKVVNIPKTPTVLALGLLAGNFWMLPLLSTLDLKPEYRDAAIASVGVFKDGLLIALGYYFSRPHGREPKDPAP